jgi:hypothetical protein
VQRSPSTVDLTTYVVPPLRIRACVASSVTWPPVDASLREPTGWRASAGTGVVLGLPAVGVVLLFAAEADDDAFVAVILWLLLALPLAACVAAATWLTIDRLGWRFRRWCWAVALSPVLAVVVPLGALAGGPSGSTPERAAGWAAVAVAMSGGAAVAAGRRVSVPVRVVAAIAVVIAAPAMVGFDHASQYRWRTANLAGSPAVLPVISSFRPVAARPDLGSLQVDMAGPTRLVVRIDRCRGSCVARDVSAVGTRTFVAGGYELTVAQADGAVDVLTTLSVVDVRATSHGELARLPLARGHRSTD